MYAFGICIASLIGHASASEPTSHGAWLHFRHKYIADVGNGARGDDYVCFRVETAESGDRWTGVFAHYSVEGTTFASTRDASRVANPDRDGVPWTSHRGAHVPNTILFKSTTPPTLASVKAERDGEAAIALLLDNNAAATSEDEICHMTLGKPSAIRVKGTQILAEVNPPGYFRMQTPVIDTIGQGIVADDDDAIVSPVATPEPSESSAAAEPSYVHDTSDDGDATTTYILAGVVGGVLLLSLLLKVASGSSLLGRVSSDRKRN
jgi:hypothetical protein